MEVLQRRSSEEEPLNIEDECVMACSLAQPLLTGNVSSASVTLAVGKREAAEVRCCAHLHRTEVIGKVVKTGE